MPRLELRYQHYVAIRDFMSDIELEPEDAMTPGEAEALDLVKQIVSNIEKSRSSPARPVRYSRKK